MILVISFKKQWGDPMEIQHNPRYLGEREVAKILGLSVQTLRNRRFLGHPPPYVKLGRSVRYLLADILAWAETNKVTPRGL